MQWPAWNKERTAWTRKYTASAACHAFSLNDSEELLRPNWRWILIALPQASFWYWFLGTLHDTSIYSLHSRKSLRESTEYASVSNKDSVLQISWKSSTFAFQAGSILCYWESRSVENTKPWPNPAPSFDSTVVIFQALQTPSHSHNL